MKTLGISFIVLLSGLDIYLNGGLTHTVLLLAVLLLKAQAEFAAEKWQKIRANFPLVPFAWKIHTEGRWVEPEPEEEKGKAKEPGAAPFQAPNSFEPISLEEARQRKKNRQAQNPEKEEVRKSSPAATSKPAPPRPVRFQTPRFSGQPHEILGIESESPTGRIIQAYKHWMKQYHPDKTALLGTKAKQSEANEYARKIHEAKQQMVNKRRKLRSAA